MFNEWYRPDCCLEFPRGGSQAIVQALVRYWLLSRPHRRQKATCGALRESSSVHKHACT